ncbi:DUF4832 domain-containing protein [Desertivirga arenae]|uniref:DUF4832 domain-containing protein n=1 Tax=Desertivirga arenae TaxID=2810309 RepID=UPI001A96249A|nr:DUF4832 domain-containing protein [Pedobacter sp. SYSU D00823]
MATDSNYYKRLLLGVVTMCIMGWVTSCKKNSPAQKEEEETKLNYEISYDIFPNPERGFTKTIPTYSDGTGLNLTQLKTFRSQNITLVVRVFYLNLYKNKQLDQPILNLIQTDLDKLREAGLKGVIRFAYTDDINGTDAPLSIVEQHIDQLKSIVDINKDVIAFVQAGFIGAWGEWHSSSNGLATTENERAVLTKLLSAFPKEILLQVRTPRYKQQVYNTTSALTKEQGFGGTDIARVGHHNDCFLSSTDDYGTYSNVGAEKQYISSEGLYVPVGGETCPPLGGFSPNCLEGRNQMKLLRWTYINTDYYQPTLSAWKASGCFEEFERGLGYRLALVNSKLPTTATVNSSYPFAVDITNNGYAPAYNKKVTSLVLKNKTTGSYSEIKLNYDIRDCKPLATASIVENLSLAGIPAGEYALYLKIADQSDRLKARAEYSVRMANKNTWTEENGGMNNLLSSLQIK